MAAQASWARKLPAVNDSASFEIPYVTSAQVALESDELYPSGAPRNIGNSAFRLSNKRKSQKGVN